MDHCLGTFPEGTLISGYRCIDPNTSARGAEEHNAECVCDGAKCEWDRDLPVCTTHGREYSGYSWTITSSPVEGSICVSVNTGGVGIVGNRKCLIEMSNEVAGRQHAKSGPYTLNVKLSGQIFCRPLNQVDPFYTISNDPIVFTAAYPAFHPASGITRNENEFHTLIANDDSCSDAFTWVPVYNLIDEAGILKVSSLEGAMS